MLLLVSWAAASARRSEVYGWLAGLFAQELTQQQFECYAAGEAAGMLSLLAELGLDAECARLGMAIAGFSAEHASCIDLKSDFAQLFLLDGRSSALPYASYYLEGKQQLYGDAELRMRHFLEQSGLRVSQEFREPADHLAVYLALLESWARQDAALAGAQIGARAGEQAQFLREAVLSWLPAFAASCQSSQRLGSDFYPALAALLLSFIVADAEYLNDVCRA